MASRPLRRAIARRPPASAMAPAGRLPMPSPGTTASQAIPADSISSAEATTRRVSAAAVTALAAAIIASVAAATVSAEVATALAAEVIVSAAARWRPLRWRPFWRRPLRRRPPPLTCCPAATSVSNPLNLGAPRSRGPHERVFVRGMEGSIFRPVLARLPSHKSRLRSNHPRIPAPAHDRVAISDALRSADSNCPVR